MPKAHFPYHSAAKCGREPRGVLAVRFGRRMGYPDAFEGFRPTAASAPASLHRNHDMMTRTCEESCIVVELEVHLDHWDIWDHKFVFSVQMDTAERPHLLSAHRDRAASAAAGPGVLEGRLGHTWENRRIRRSPQMSSHLGLPWDTWGCNIKIHTHRCRATAWQPST